MTKTVSAKRWHLTDVALQVRAESDLPPGVAGRVSGVALTYEVVDAYDTMFARGSAKRSIDTRVAARKLPLLMDHERSTRAHVGVVTAMEDVGDALVMTADVFDTAEGRAALEYVKAVLASGASTGFSIGFVPRRSETVKAGDKTAERFTEIELREVSITPMPAVPGADVTGARNEPEHTEAERTDDDLLIVAARAALDALPSESRRAVLAAYADAIPTASSPASPDTGTQTADAPDAKRAVPMEARLRAIQQSFTY
jgi:HK97 family phage prohead protease